MKKLQWIAVFSLCTLSLPAFAYYCSTQHGNGFIDIGNTMEQVVSACGEPNQKSDPSVYQDSKMVTTQYWIYDNTQAYRTNVLAIEETRVVNRDAPTLVVEVTDGIVTNITQGGDETQSGYCAARGNTVQIGNSIDALNSTCGTPTAVNIQQRQATQTPPQEKVIWTYQWDSYTQPLHLEFLNGKLKNIGE